MAKSKRALAVKRSVRSEARAKITASKRSHSQFQAGRSDQTAEPT
jgi:hypothetical protein